MLGFEKTYTFPFRYGIPSYIKIFLKESSITKHRIKYIKRCIYIILKQQKHLEIDQILPEHSNILWINLSAPSLGDSLMDLSSRVLLERKRIDLFTDEKNAHLYKNDAVFTTIYLDIDAVKQNKYDLIIIDSYSTRSVKAKANIAPSTPFVGMFGYFNGPEVNRVLFSFHRMNHLLGYVKSEIEINNNSRASLSIDNDKALTIDNTSLPENYIAIALGGEWAYRTYGKWGELIKQLIEQDKDLNIVFIGSENAKESAITLAKAFSGNNIINCVAKHTFLQTAQIVKGAKVLLCCDGGLMHAANSVGTPIIPLFAWLTPIMQLTQSVQAFPLFDDKDVNNIPVKDIVDRYVEASNFLSNHPLGE